MQINEQNFSPKTRRVLFTKRGGEPLHIGISKARTESYSAVQKFNGNDHNGIRWAIAAIYRHESAFPLSVVRISDGLLLCTKSTPEIAMYLGGILKVEYRRLRARRARRRYRSKSIL